MDGWLLIDKPVGMSSYAVVAKIKKTFGTKKVGHCGTLDPFASGLLAVTLNGATKISRFIESGTKTYEAKLVLGSKTETGDCEGAVIETRPVPALETKQIKSVLESFKGDTQQIPPMYSALKVAGQPLYKLARKGQEVERTPRTIHINSIELLNYDQGQLTFRVSCSKGTYIRTLGEDIASKLGTVGHLEALRRTAIGSFTIQDALKLDDISEQTNLLPLALGLKDWPSLSLSGEMANKAKHGCLLELDEQASILVIKDEANKPIAVYEKRENCYHCLRGL